MTSEGKPCEVCPDSKRDICWRSTQLGCPTWEAWITMVNQIKRVSALSQKWRNEAEFDNKVYPNHNKYQTSLNHADELEVAVKGESCTKGEDTK